MKLTPENEKNFIAFCVIIASFGIFLVFFQNQESISISDITVPFTLLAALGMALMIVLFFLVSKRVGRTGKKKRR